MKKRHALYVALALAGACIEGGANNGGNQSGNKDGGVVLALGEIAVDSHGRYFLTRADGKLVVGDLGTRAMDRLEELPSPDIIAFWAHSNDPGFYLLSWRFTDNGTETLVAESLISYDLDRKRIAWRREFDGRLDGRLEVSPDGRRVLIAGGTELIALDPGTGTTLWSAPIAHGMNDADITSDGGRLIITGETKRDDDRRPSTVITVRAMTDGQQLCEVTVPNCTSELVLANDARRAFLAPTSCGRDPVSVIELDGDACSFRENLPGFGPVALSPGGDTVVAFLDRDTDDPTAPPIPDAIKTSADRYHLMFIDTDTLAFETSPLGAELPRYTFTPDGRSLLVDNDRDMEHATPMPIVILDVDARTARIIEGPSVELDEYALTPDAAHAYVVDAGLFDLEIGAAKIEQIALPFSPMSLNMTPDGKTLLLKSAIDSKVHVYEVDESKISGELSCDDACAMAAR